MASIPVELYIANPPAVDLTVNLTLNAELPAQQVTLNTSTLIFGPDIESRYFTITVASGYDTSVNPSTGTVSFTFSGTNANSYANISDFSFTIEQPSSTTTVSAPSLSHTDPNKTSVKITGTSTQIGVYYNYCGP